MIFATNCMSIGVKERTVMPGSKENLLYRADRVLRSRLSLRRAALRVRSLYSGVPYAQLKLYYLIGVRLKQVSLTERGTGQIIDHAAGDFQRVGIEAAHLANLLAAISRFERNPDAAFLRGLHSVNLGHSLAYIHGSPQHIRAAEFEGPSIKQLQQLIGEVTRRPLQASVAAVSISPDGGKGAAKRIAASLVKALVAADLPPFGVRPRPLFSYGAIAAVSLLLITATGEALLKPGQFFWEQPAAVDARDMEGDAKGIGIKADDKTNDLIHANATLEITSRREVTAAKEQNGPFFEVSGSPDLISWQLNRALLKFTAAEPAPAALDLDRFIEAGLAGLSQSKLEGLPNLNLTRGLTSDAQALDTDGLTGAAGRSLPSLPVSVTGQGFSVGLFSLSSDGSAVSSVLDAGQSAASGVTSTTSSVAPSAAQTVTGAAAGQLGNATSATGQTLSGVSSTLRGLGR
jgi:hypothetical protein